MRIAVLGAGSWGTTVASLLAGHHDCTIWARDPELAREIYERDANFRGLVHAADLVTRGGGGVGWDTFWHNSAPERFLQAFRQPGEMRSGILADRRHAHQSRQGRAKPPLARVNEPVGVVARHTGFLCLAAGIHLDQQGRPPRFLLAMIPVPTLPHRKQRHRWYTRKLLCSTRDSGFAWLRT